MRLEFVGTLIVMGAALFAVLARTSYLSSTSPIEDDEATHKHLELFAGLAGLSMSLAMSITQSLNWTVRMASDLESQMVAVERLEEYATMSQEKAHYRVNDPVIGGADGSGNSPLHASASGTCGPRYMNDYCGGCNGAVCTRALFVSQCGPRRAKSTSSTCRCGTDRRCRWS